MALEKCIARSAFTRLASIASITFAIIMVHLVGCDRGAEKTADQPRRRIGTLRLRTFPKNAKVWVDGKTEIARTPATLLLEEGRHILHIQADGAQAVEEVVNIKGNAKQSLHLRIPEPPPAKITVLSDEIGASVRINGFRRGETPLLDAVTRPGPVDITLTTPEGKAKSVQSTLGIGEEKLIEVFFYEVSSKAPKPVEKEWPMCRLAATGRLTLGLNPKGTVEAENGELWGYTPIVDKELEAGEYAVTLRSKDGRYEKRVTIEIEQDQHAIYRFQLNREDEVPTRK